MLPRLTAQVASVPLQFVPLQAVPEFLAGSPIGKLLVALVVIALVVFIGRFVLSMAWKLIRIAIVVVGLLWLLSVVIPAVGI